MGVLIAALTAVLNFIVRLLCGVAKLLYRVLRALGLQVPVLYLCAMLIVDLATGGGIRGSADYTSLFWLGLVLTLVLSACLTVRRIFYPKHKREEAYYRKKFAREQEREANKAASREERRAARNEARKPKLIDPGLLTEDSPTKSAAPLAEPAESRPQLEDACFSAPTAMVSSVAGDSASAPAAEPAECNAPTGRAAPPLPVKRSKTVRYPLVYRVRQDERFLLYEYEDRTELYFERPDGLRYLRTDKK